MQIKSLTAAAVLSLASLAPVSQAATIGFEDIPMTFTDPAALSYAYLTNQYGLQWSGGYQDISWTVSEATGGWFPGSQAHSGNQFAWSNGGVDLSISSSMAFTLTEFWARSGYGQADVVLTVNGYNGGVLVGTQSLAMTTTYQLMAFNFGETDKITFTSSPHANILMDDFVMTLPVPEPSTYAMLLAGLCLIGYAGKRQAQSKRA
jgi:hypothetical protein